MAEMNPAMKKRCRTRRYKTIRRRVNAGRSWGPREVWIADCLYAGAKNCRCTVKQLTNDLRKMFWRSKDLAHTGN